MRSPVHLRSLKTDELERLLEGDWTVSIHGPGLPSKGRTFRGKTEALLKCEIDSPGLDGVGGLLTWRSRSLQSGQIAWGTTLTSRGRGDVVDQFSLVLVQERYLLAQLTHGDSRWGSSEMV